MSVFNRKLFTRTPYDHYGTGIASGLVERQGFAVGGRVNYSEGGGPFDAKLNTAIEKSIIMDQKRELFDGGHGLGMSPQTSSFINTVYNIEFIKQIEEFGITRDQFNNLEKEDREKIAKTINDKIVSRLSSEYQIDSEFIEKAFGGVDGMLNDAEKGISQLLRDDPFGIQLNQQQAQRYKSEYDLMLKNIETKGPKAFETIPGTDTITETKKDETRDETGDETNNTTDDLNTPSPTDSLMTTDRTGIKSAVTTDEGRQEQVEYYKKLQEEAEMDKIARQQRMESFLINAGAADPVQKGESTMQMLAKSFKDPNEALRNRQYANAEDIYGTVRDQATDDLERGETVKLLDYLYQNPEQQALAKTVLGGSTAVGKPVEMDSKFFEQAKNMTVEEIASYYKVPVEQVESNLVQFQQVLANDLQFGAKTSMASTVPSNSLTEETITKPVLFQNGGRVGYQEGNVVQPMAAPTDESVQQNSAEQIYMQLREALPDYIQNNVVELLAKDSEALSEFVEIKTTSQVQEFEDKYRVELNLPQEDQTAAFPESQMI